MKSDRNGYKIRTLIDYGVSKKQEEFVTEISIPVRDGAKETAPVSRQNSAGK